MRLKLFNGFVILFILERVLALENQFEYDIEAPHGDQIPQRRGKNIFDLNTYLSLNIYLSLIHQVTKHIYGSKSKLSMITMF